MTKKQLRKRRAPMLRAQAFERRRRESEARERKAAEAWRRRFSVD